MIEKDITEELFLACKLPQREELAALADRLGFQEIGKTAANLCELQHLVGDPDLAVEVTLTALKTAEPDNALNYLERLYGTVDGEKLTAVLRDSDRRTQLLTILGGSAFIASILCRNATFFEHLFVNEEIDQQWSLDAMTDTLRQMVPTPCDFNALQRTLRLFKCRMITRIGGRDLCHLAPLEESTAELSCLAASTLQVAHDVCRQLLDAEYGAPRITEGPRAGEIAGFVILGMGKFGGWELNFSSDIDLIYVYRTSAGQTEGIAGAPGQPSKQISFHQYFVKLGESISRALNEATDDGFVFRVDMRLRPEGNSGELALSLQATEDYYESWGRSWERAAMIKARPVAGDLALGEELLERLKPFIYRRHLDYAMVDDIKSMKQKIDATLAHSQESELNIKLGRGGIREIEFFVQALQLINGGKQPALQQRNLLATLQALRDAELITTEEQDALVNANRMLRTVEHRVMIVNEQQTHHLPTKDSEKTALARRCGYEDWDSFSRELESHRTHVQKIYHSLFFTPSEKLEQEEDTTSGFLFDPNTSDEEIVAFFSDKGFTSPVGALESLRFLQGDTQHRPLTERGQRFLDRLGPILMAEVLASDAPEKALVNLERFVRALRARSTFFALLAENRPTIHILVKLFSSSQFLSRIFCQHPEILDAMVSRSYSIHIKSRSVMADELQVLMNNTDDYGHQLDALRRYRNEEFLRIALNDLNGDMDIDDSSCQLTLLAETILEQAVLLARQELMPRFGLPQTNDGEESRFAVIGMGKMGGYELNYHSDLDIIFIYDGDGHTEAVESADAQRFKRLPNHLYFAKLAQRIISALTLVTGEGAAYQIDTQLRPSGNQGPLVTSFTSFKEYHQRTAQPWERMALTKARTVVGHPQLQQALQKTIEQLAFERPVPEDLAAGMVRLRARMEKEIAREGEERFNIKTGRGGMVDVEFIVQYLQIVHGLKGKTLRTKKSVEALKALHQAGVLHENDCERLVNGYRFLRLMDRRLRLLHDQSTQNLKIAGPDLAKLARCFRHYDTSIRSDEIFLERYLEHTRSIRQIFDRIFGV